MSYFWFKFFLNLVLFECILIVALHPDNSNVNVTDSIGFNRHNRQIVSTDSKVKSLVALAAAAIICGSSTEEKEEIEEGCKINIKTLDFKHALIVNPNDHSKFLYPDSKGDIYFARKQEVFLSCSGEGNKFDQIDGTQYATFSCICGDIFELNTKAYRFNSLNCTEYPKSEIIDRGKLDNVYVLDDVDEKVDNIYEIDESKIQHIYHRYNIGFFTDSKKFLNIITVIYRDDLSTPWHAKSVISGFIEGGQRTSARKPFDTKYCCNGKDYINMDSLYNVDTQDHTFEYLLHSHTVGSENPYLKKETSFVFNRGHLTPKSSMVYSAAGIATHAFINAIPQWRIINSGNWGRTEEHIVDMAKTFRYDLTVYTGVFGTLKLKDTADGDKMKPIYLYATKERENTIKEFPVPLYNYKLVFDLENNKGVVFVTINNPFIEDPTQYHICDNPMTKMDGVKMPNWKINKKTKQFDLTAGYSYMCTVQDFYSKSHLVPVDFVGLRIDDLLYIPDGSQVKPTPAPVSTTTEFKRFDDDLKKKKSL